MPALGWIDDEPGLLGSYVAQTRALLPKKWKVIGSAPLHSIDDYVSWLAKNDVSVLLLDQRLGDAASVSYKGHDVLAEVRRRWPEFPILMVTGYEGDLASRKGEFEDIIQKRSIGGELRVYIKRAVRAGMRYRHTYQMELDELSKLSAKVATGGATGREKSQLRALQTKLQLAVVPEPDEKRAQLLETMERKIDALAVLVGTLSKKGKLRKQ